MELEYKETEIKVIDLVNLIIDHSPSRVIIRRDYLTKHLLKSLDFNLGNKHIQNPLNKDPENPSFVDREKSLTGNEVVYGDYLVYDCIGHFGTELVWKFDSLEEAEEHMLNEGGLSNWFTTYMFLIEYGKYKEFEYDEYNNKITWLS